MLTTSIIFLLLAGICGWYGISTFLGYSADICNSNYYLSPVTQVLFNPGLYWIVASAITLILAAVCLVCTLRTKKQDRFGKKLPLYVAEISTTLLGAALLVATIFVNFNFGYYVRVNNTNNFELQILPIVVGGLFALVGFILLVIQILKGVNPAFSVKVENSRIYGFFRDYKSEMKKITWTSKKDVVRNTIMVCATLILVGLLVALIDLGFTQLMLLIGA